LEWTKCTKSGKQFREFAADWKWLPGRLEKLSQLKREGIRMAVATNQGGVAYGFLQKGTILAQLVLMCRLAGIPVGGLYVCYTHPKAKLEEYRMEDDRRKPGPRMLLEAMADFETGPDETLYVGDLDVDEQAAKNAGIDFVWASSFFGD